MGALVADGAFAHVVHHVGHRGLGARSLTTSDPPQPPQKQLRAPGSNSSSGEASAIGAVEPELDWYLDEWLCFAHPNAAANLLRFLQKNAMALANGRLWSDRGAADAKLNRSKVIAWAKAEANFAAVADAADRARASDERDALEECYLRWLG